MIGLSSYQIWYRSLPNSEKNYGQIPEIEIQYIFDLYSEKKHPKRSPDRRIIAIF